MYKEKPDFHIKINAIYNENCWSYSDVCPPKDEFSFPAHEEWVEAQVVHAEVHPALPGDVTFPVAARVIWKQNMNCDASLWCKRHTLTDFL